MTLDQSHERLVDTSISGNPTEGVIDGLHMQYVFRRKTSKKHSRDGNPLVYALKEMHGYRIQPMYTGMLWKIVDNILAKFAGNLEVDFLIDVPSSKPLCQIFALRISKASGIPLVKSTFLRKRTVEEVLSKIDGQFPSFIRDLDEKEFKAELGKLRHAQPRDDFQMKKVSKRMRHFFTPFIMNDAISLPRGQRVALIDDLVSSGTSIISVANSLREQGLTVERGVSLFSGLNGM